MPPEDMSRRYALAVAIGVGLGLVLALVTVAGNPYAMLPLAQLPIVLLIPPLAFLLAPLLLFSGTRLVLVGFVSFALAGFLAFGLFLSISESIGDWRHTRRVTEAAALFTQLRPYAAADVPDLSQARYPVLLDSTTFAAHPQILALASGRDIVAPVRGEMTLFKPSRDEKCRVDAPRMQLLVGEAPNAFDASCLSKKTFDLGNPHILIRTRQANAELAALFHGIVDDQFYATTIECVGCAETPPVTLYHFQEAPPPFRPGVRWIYKNPALSFPAVGEGAQYFGMVAFDVAALHVSLPKNVRRRP